MNIEQINNLREALNFKPLTEFPAIDIMHGEEGAQDVLGRDRLNAEPAIASDLMDKDLRHIAFFPSFMRFYTRQDLDDLRGY